VRPADTDAGVHGDALGDGAARATATRAQVAAALQRSTDALAAGDLVGSFDGWNSLWVDYWSDYPGRTNFGRATQRDEPRPFISLSHCARARACRRQATARPKLFTNITGGTDTENVW
jgi:hypothetical protein